MNIIFEILYLLSVFYLLALYFSLFRNVVSHRRETKTTLGYKGENIFTGQDDAKLISEGIYKTYQTKNLRYSQVAPIDMFKEVNTNNNLPSKRVVERY